MDQIKRFLSQRVTDDVVFPDSEIRSIDRLEELGFQVCRYDTSLVTDQVA